MSGDATSTRLAAADRVLVQQEAREVADLEVADREVADLGLALKVEVRVGAGLVAEGL